MPSFSGTKGNYCEPTQKIRQNILMWWRHKWHGCIESQWLRFGTDAIQSRLTQETRWSEPVGSEQRVLATNGWVTKNRGIRVDERQKHERLSQTWNEQRTRQPSAWGRYGQTWRCMHGSALYLQVRRLGRCKETLVVGQEYLRLSLPDLENDHVVLLQLRCGNISADYLRSQTVWHSKCDLITAIFYSDHVDGVI